MISTGLPTHSLPTAQFITSASLPTAHNSLPVIRRATPAGLLTQLPHSLAHPQTKSAQTHHQKVQWRYNKVVNLLGFRHHSVESAIHNNPVLSPIEKFNYLKSYVKVTAIEAEVRKLPLIINQHMNSLLLLRSFSSHNNLKSPRQLFNSVEAHVRGLWAPGVSTDIDQSSPPYYSQNFPQKYKWLWAESYLVEAGVWRCGKREVSAKQRSAVVSQVSKRRILPTREHHHREIYPTAAFLVAGNQEVTQSVYC